MPTSKFVVSGLALLGSAAAAILNESLPERIAAGECTAQPVEEGGTFFGLANRTVKDDAFAEFFDIIYAPSYKVVTSKLAKEQYVLTQCGQEAPSDEVVNEIAPLATDYIRKHFDVPLRSYLAASTVHYGFLDELGVDDRAGHVKESWATEPCWQKAYGCSSGSQPPDDSADFQWDALFTSTLHSNHKPGSHPKTIFVPAVQDPSPLNTAEYIKFFGVFFNKDAASNDLFAEVKAGYEAANSGYDSAPVVAWIERSSFGADEFKISEVSYKLDMITHAGGKVFDAETALADVPGVRIETTVAGRNFHIPVSAFDDEFDAAGNFTEALAGVDVVVDATYAPNPFEYTLESFLDNYNIEDDSTLNFVKNKMVVRFDGTISDAPNYGLDWFESRMARPDWAVNGLARCLHKDTTKTARYFRNIAIGEAPEVFTAAMCDVKLPLCGEGEPEKIPLIGDGKGPKNSAPAPWSFGQIVLVLLIAVVVFAGVAMLVTNSYKEDHQVSPPVETNEHAVELIS